MRACSSMWSNERYLMLSSVLWMWGSLLENSDSMTKAEG